MAVPRAVCSITVALLASGGSSCAQAPSRDGQAPQIRDLDQDPYRTPRAGEGFRADVFGEVIEEGPRNRRSVAAWDIGIASAPRVENTPVLPFGSLYFWENPDDDFLFRATIVGVFNEVLVAKSPSGWGGAELLGSFESFTVPAATAEFVDGEILEQTSMYWGYVRPGFGLGYRDQVGPAQDNLFEANVTAEPGLLYFARGDDTGEGFETPPTTFEMRTRARIRLDLLERNLLELPHSGVATGADLVYGHRASWDDDWGDPELRGFGEDSTQDYLVFSGYAIGVTGLPFVSSDRHRLLASVHGGIGDDLDRFSALRVGGGPDPRGEEYGSVSRPILPGSAISEFLPEHYAIGYLGYRFEPVFFAYLDAGATVAWLDRDRLLPDGTVRREDDVLRALSARLTSGFLGRTRIQLLYAYNFDVVRDGAEGGFEVTFHVSGSF